MKSSTEQKGLVVGLLTSPWSILVSVGIAAFLGIMFKDVAVALKPIGQIYLYMIEMTVIPIIISAVISSVAGLANSAGIRAFLVRMIVVFVLMLVGAAVIGTVAGVIGNPGSGLDEETRNTLGSIVKTQQSQYAPDLEISLTAPVERAEQQGLVDFLVRMVPRNIFHALNVGGALELIFFSIIFGVAVGVLGAKYGESLTGIFDGFFKAFQKIISWLMVALPFGLICLLADQIASTGFQILLAMLRFILIFYAVGLLVVVLDVLIIWRRSRQSLGKVLKALLDPIVISLVTRSSFAALPTAIRGLSQHLGFYERSTSLFFSLGVTLGRFGNIIYFSIASIFVAQLYGAELGLAQYGMVVVGSLFAGVATAGASGIATLNLLAIVLGPLGLPLEAVLIIFIAIDTIADPLRTMLIILTNMAANTLIVPTVHAMNRRRLEAQGGHAARSEAGVDLLSTIRDRRELRVAVEARDTPPFVYRGEDGKLHGISVELAQRVASHLGAEAKFDRRAESAADLVTMCREGDVDIVAGSCNFHRVFESELVYTTPYVVTKEAVLISKARLTRLREGGGDLLAAFRGTGGSVGVVRGSVHAATVGRLFPKASVTEYGDTGELTDALLANSLVAAIGTEIELKHAIEMRPTRAASVSCVSISNPPAEYRIGIAPVHSGAIDALNTAVAEAKALPWSATVAEKAAASSGI